MDGYRNNCYFRTEKDEFIYDSVVKRMNSSFFRHFSHLYRTQKDDFEMVYRTQKDDLIIYRTQKDDSTHFTVLKWMNRLILPYSKG